MLSTAKLWGSLGARVAQQQADENQASQRREGNALQKIHGCHGRKYSASCADAQQASRQGVKDPTKAAGRRALAPPRLSIGFFMRREGPDVCHMP